MDRSLRTQLVWPLVLVTLVCVVAIVGLSQWLAKRDAVASMEQRLTAIEERLRTSTFPLTRPVLATIRDFSGADLIILDGDGRIGESTLEEPLTASIGQIPLPPSDGRPTMFDLKIGDRAFEGMMARRKLPQQDIESRILILIPHAELLRSQSQLRWWPLVLGTCAALLIAATASALVHRLLCRLRQLEQHVGQLATGNEPTTKFAGPNDELHHLAGSVESMASDLRQLAKRDRDARHWQRIHQLTSGLAHELRNAMTGARMAVQLHQHQCSHPHRDDLQVAERELRRSESQLGGLLKASSGQHPEAIPASLSSIVDEVVDLTDATARHRQTRLTWQRSDAMAQWTVPDGEAMRTSLLNLVLNAIQAAGPQGAVHVDVMLESSLAHVIVRDDGPGPPPTMSDSLFEPFATARRDGIGLGLSLVRDAVQRLGGRVWWTRGGQGTEFHLETPHA
jgi:signal transduction histidine kinase